MQNRSTYTVILSGILAVFFVGIAALRLSGHTDLYYVVMRGLGVNAFSLPFLDLHGVLAMGECHRLGVDPTIPNPCDPLHRILPYGPILLREPFAMADAAALGTLQSLLFLVAAVLVLRPRTRVELVVAVAALLSGGVLYALERGNFDVAEFLLVAVGAFLATRMPAGRLGSYILFYWGGTVKFYPFALLVTIARERLAMAIGLATLGFALIAGYLLVYRDTLSKLSTALPPFEYNTDVFGAACLPFGLADWLMLPISAGQAAMALLVAVFGHVAWRIGKRLQEAVTAADLKGLNFHLLIAGAIVLVGCYFMGPSITYRSIFLLLLVPGLFDLARKPGLRRLAHVAIGVAVFCLWSEFFRQWGEVVIDSVLDRIAPDRGDNLAWASPDILFFAARELLWWWLIALLSAIVGVFLFNARAIREALGTSTPE